MVDNNRMKLEINSRGKSGKFTNTWKLKHILDQSLVKEEIFKKRFKKHLVTNENKSTTYQNVQDEAKAIPKGKFLILNI